MNANVRAYEEAAAQRQAGMLGFSLAGFLLAVLPLQGLADRDPGCPPPSMPPESENLPPESENGGHPPGGFADDETIGSLPMMAGEILFLLPGAPNPDLPPRFYIEGPTAVILDGLIDAQGTGQITLHPAQGEGRSVATVYGHLFIALDAALFTHPEVEAGLIVGAELGHVSAGIFYQGRLVQRAVIEPMGRLPVPIGGLYEMSALKDGVDLYSATGRGGRNHVRLSAFGGTVVVQQMN